MRKPRSTRAIAATKRAGHKVALTLSDPFCVGRWREEFLALAGKTISISCSPMKKRQKRCSRPMISIRPCRLRAMSKGILALTRSEKGCVVANEKEVHVLDAEPVTRVVDTTGAGDQFAAGFLYGLTHGKPLDQCGRLGAIAAAEVISHYGARPEVKLSEFL